MSRLIFNGWLFYSNFSVLLCWIFWNGSRLLSFFEVALYYLLSRVWNYSNINITDLPSLQERSNPEQIWLFYKKVQRKIDLQKSYMGSVNDDFNVLMKEVTYIFISNIKVANVVPEINRQQPKSRTGEINVIIPLSIFYERCLKTGRYVCITFFMTLRFLSYA